MFIIKITKGTEKKEEKSLFNFNKHKFIHITYIGKSATTDSIRVQRGLSVLKTPHLTVCPENKSANLFVENLIN
jgi:hypothetical protein